jgi:hypothetical protein
VTKNAVTLAITQLFGPAALVTDEFFCHVGSDFNVFWVEMKVENWLAFDVPAQRNRR